MIKAGDIIFVRGTGLIPRLVRFFDGRGEFSHVAIAISDTEIIETNWNMRSKIIPMYYLEEDYEIVRLHDMTDQHKENLPFVAKSLQGKFYDYFQILAILFRSRLNNPRYLICSELVYLILFEIGYEKDVRLLNSTPNEMYNKMKVKQQYSTLSLG